MGMMGRVKRGKSVSIGMIVMFCINRIENVECFSGVCMRFFLLRVCRIIVVDESVKINLIVSVIDYV